MYWDRRYHTKLPPDNNFDFFFVSLQIGTIKEDIATTVDNLHSSRVSLKLHLQSIHFAGSVLNPGNSLLLRCTSQIGNIYLETKEIELGTPQRDPIPARGNYHSINLLNFIQLERYKSL